MEKLLLNVNMDDFKDFFEGSGYEAECLNVDVLESPFKAESPREYSKRVANVIADKMHSECKDMIVVSIYKVVSVGRRILPKASSKEDAHKYIKFLSGRNHRVFVSICLVFPDGEKKEKIIEVTIKFKGLSDVDIARYLTKEYNWYGCAGGYNIESNASIGLIKSVNGGFGALSKVPLYELDNMLKSI